jgi:DnaJ-class molecular chaperone
MRLNINYYTVLGVKTDATRDEIKDVYKKLAVIYHPDKGGDENKFKQIAEAYKILTDDIKRNEYDTKSMFGTKYDSSYDLYNFEFNQNTTYNDINNNLNKFKSNGLIDILLRVKKSTFKNSIHYDRKVYCKSCDGSGKDIHAKTKCFACIGNGVNRNGDNCMICSGEGYISNYDDCDYCNGIGKVKDVKCHFCKGLGKIYSNICTKCKNGISEKTENIQINIEDFKDDKLLIRGMGNYSEQENGVVGNLYIILVDE